MARYSASTATNGKYNLLYILTIYYKTLSFRGYGKTMHNCVFHSPLYVISQGLFRKPTVDSMILALSTEGTSSVVWGLRSSRLALQK